MDKKGHSEEQIVAVLRQVEGGERVAEMPQGGSARRPTVCGRGSMPDRE